MFVDEVKVSARAGHGGRGCVAFLREAFRPKGGPIGGDGGRGGNVILRADHDLNNLVNQYHAPTLKAQNGAHGLGKGMNGKSGKDLIVKIPCGTVVWRLTQEKKIEPPGEEEAETATAPEGGFPVGSATRSLLPRANHAPAIEIDLAEEEPEAPKGPSAVPERGEMVVDLVEHGQEFILCRGGRGGFGNRHFANSRRQAPRFAQPGEPGEEGEFLLELRTIADIGLVGYPNAGKSTLLSAVSRAHPRVAPYPFTTKHPHVGVVDYDDWFRVTLCDVPGLIEGAHKNVGLGHEFLRHIRRCRALAIVVDMAGIDGREPVDDYRQLLAELKLYDPELLERPQFIVANKMDEKEAEARLDAFKSEAGDVEIVPMAAAFDEGLKAFRHTIRRLAEETR